MAFKSAAHDVDLNAADYFSERQREVMAVMESSASLPSCNKLAAKSLLHDCATLESNDNGHEREPLIEVVKSVYAARLAVCELREGSSGITIPAACISFVPDSENSGKTQDGWRGYFGNRGPTKPQQYDRNYETATEADVEKCVAALHETGTGWTSYSNNKQNAVVMCHAVRGELERDSILELLRSFVQITGNSLADVVETSDELDNFKKNFEDLSVAVRKFMINLQMDEQERRVEVQQVWSSMLNSFKTHLHDASAMVREHQEQLVAQGDLIDLNNAKVADVGSRALQTVSEIGSAAHQNTQDTLGALTVLSDQARFALELNTQTVQQWLMRMNLSIEDATQGAISVMQEINRKGSEGVQQTSLVYDLAVATEIQQKTTHHNSIERQKEIQAGFDTISRQMESVTDQLLSWQSWFSGLKFLRFAIYFLLVWIIAGCLFNDRRFFFIEGKSIAKIIALFCTGVFAISNGPIDWMFRPLIRKADIDRTTASASDSFWRTVLYLLPLVCGSVAVLAGLFVCWKLWLRLCQSLWAAPTVYSQQPGSDPSTALRENSSSTNSYSEWSNAANKYTPESVKEREQASQRLSPLLEDRVEQSTEDMTIEQMNSMANGAHVFPVRKEEV